MRRNGTQKKKRFALTALKTRGDKQRRTKGNALYKKTRREEKHQTISTEEFTISQVERTCKIYEVDVIMLHQLGIRTVCK
mmetsp:Transcript_12662/g.19612  ORF Transcript_12662/g.19612 Transcript_12662/m.19612 type:complete len:80 (-) Transcript_12662:39-278(-)